MIWFEKMAEVKQGKSVSPVCSMDFRSPRILRTKSILAFEVRDLSRGATTESLPNSAFEFQRSVPFLGLATNDER
jgi:hypothetical protein